MSVTVTPPLAAVLRAERHQLNERFAAARVVGRTFRGLLAGGQGKVWAERFDLGEFPGVVPLVARLLRVPATAVKVLRSPEG